MSGLTALIINDITHGSLSCSTYWYLSLESRPSPRVGKVEKERGSDGARGKGLDSRLLVSAV